MYFLECALEIECSPLLSGHYSKDCMEFVSVCLFVGERASERVEAELLNMPIHKPHRQRKKKKLLFLNRKNHWRINIQSGRPQEQIHRQADVSMQNFGKRPDSVEKTMRPF